MHNRRNQQAATRRSPSAKVATKPRAKDRPAPKFPADIQIPPHRGATARLASIPLPIPLAAVTPPNPAKVAARPLFAMPSPEAEERPRTRPKRKAKVKAKAKPRSPATKPAPVIALPAMPEPLIAAAPLPKERALALHRPAGLFDQLARWLGRRLELTWQRLGGVKPDAASELKRLRQENARLQAQLEALLALQNTRSRPARTGAMLPQA